MVKKLRVPELKEILLFADVSIGGLKTDLMLRALRLIKIDRSQRMLAKIKELYAKRFTRPQRMYSAPCNLGGPNYSSIGESSQPHSDHSRALSKGVFIWRRASPGTRAGSLKRDLMSQYNL